MTKHSGQLRIISDGMGPTTVVMDGNDVVLDNVGSITLMMAAGEVNHADITFVGTGVDIKTSIGTVEFICPICEQISSHECTPQTMGGL